MAKYIRLNNGEILYDNNISEANDLESNNISSNPLNILKEGDLVNIEYYLPIYDERLVELFQVYSVSRDLSLIYLRNNHTNLHIHMGSFVESEYEPVLISIITREKIENSEFSLNIIYNEGRSR